MGGAGVGVVLGQHWFPVSAWRTGGHAAASDRIFAGPAVCSRVHLSPHTRSCAYACRRQSSLFQRTQVSFTLVAPCGEPPRPSTRISRLPPSRPLPACLSPATTASMQHVYSYTYAHLSPLHIHHPFSFSLSLLYVVARRTTFSLPTPSRSRI